MSNRFTSIAAGAVFAALAAGFVSMGSRGGHIDLGFGPSVAEAQNLGMRAVAGSVVDASSTPVAGATVFIKDLKTKAIRSYTSTANGRFRFTQVSMSEDHDLWAEKDGKKSVTKTVSSWDTRKDFEVELKLK